MSDGATLRDQQAEFTRQLLLEAARKVIIHTDPGDFTIQKVAEEAGVSHRTVYRYFPSRQALIDDFSSFLESEFASGRIMPPGLDDIDDLVRQVFAIFDEHAEYYEAAARLSGGNLRPANQAERTARMRELFDREFSHLEPRSADKAFAVLRYLVGLQTWFTMRERFGLGDGESADAIGWATSELVRALKEGRAPKSN